MSAVMLALLFVRHIVLLQQQLRTPPCSNHKLRYVGTARPKLGPDAEGSGPGLPILTAWQLESRATIVEEQAVSTVKQGPRKERTCEMRPLDVWTHWRRSLAAR